MAIVVSDTSPIRALANLQLVELLRDLFGTVYVPPAVATELSHPTGTSVRVEITRYPFLILERPLDEAGVRKLQAELDPGESEAIILAIEKGASLLLIDERAGAKAAAQHGLLALGVVGVLVRAKRSGRVDAVGPLLERLRDVYRFHVSAELLQTAKQLAGEA